MRFVTQKKLKPMIKWSDRAKDRKSTYLSKLIKSTRSLLALLSGEDTIPMLKCILTKSELESLASENHRKALINLVFFLHFNN
jgi:hypothetical protein